MKTSAKVRRKKKTRKFKPCWANIVKEKINVSEMAAKLIQLLLIPQMSFLLKMFLLLLAHKAKIQTSIS